MIEPSHILETISSSFSLVAISEMGDKTQLLAFSLASRFKKPLPILAGIFVATLLNHWLAALIGATAASYFSPATVSWTLAVVFVVFGLWILVPDKLEDEDKKPSSHGAFITTTILFFLAEMGDKTQLATIALAARFTSTLLVTVGTTIGMMFTNGLAVFAGDRLSGNAQAMKYVRWAAAALFIVFGVLSALQALRS